MNPYSTQLIDSKDIQAVIHALQSKHLTQGEQTEAFEEELASYLGVKYVLTYNSATSALYCAYKALELKNYQVITSPLSFVATANMLLEVGAEPVFCDIKVDGNIDEKRIQALINRKTKAIVSVDYAGKSVEAPILAKLAKDHNLAFISDSSHSFGGQYKGQKIGSFADATIFSFHAVKPFTTAEGGAIATNNKTLYQKAKLTRSHGVLKKALWNSDVEQSGFNFRLSEIAAALGRSQLQKIDHFIATREENARLYDELFAQSPFFDILPMPEHIKSSRHLYPIFLKQNFWCVKEAIFSRLIKQGLGVQVHYKPIHLFSLYKSFQKTPLYQAERFYHAELSIPCHQKMNKNDVAQTADIILETFSKL